MFAVDFHFRHMIYCADPTTHLDVTHMESSTDYLGQTSSSPMNEYPLTEHILMIHCDSIINDGSFLIRLQERLMFLLGKRCLLILMSVKG